MKIFATLCVFLLGQTGVAAVTKAIIFTWEMCTLDDSADEDDVIFAAGRVMDYYDGSRDFEEFDFGYRRNLRTKRELCEYYYCGHSFCAVLANACGGQEWCEQNCRRRLEAAEEPRQSEEEPRELTDQERQLVLDGWDFHDSYNAWYRPCLQDADAFHAGLQAEVAPDAHPASKNCLQAMKCYAVLDISSEEIDSIQGTVGGAVLFDSDP